MSKASCLLFIILFTLNIVISENYSIEGYALNGMTNEPIENVNVYLKDYDLGATTNDIGYFNFLINDNTKELYLEFSHIAYETVRWRGEMTGIITIEMKETLLKLDEIVITGTRTEFTSSDVPVFTEIINSGDIRSSSAFTVGDIIEERAGVCKTYNFDGSFDYNLLGLDSKYILILKDGQPITGKFNDKLDLDQLAISNVERIEIMKGPGSSLYGTEAMGGVINIISKNSTDSYSGELKIKSSSYDGVSSNWMENPNSYDITYDFSFPIKSFRVNANSLYQNLRRGENFAIAGKDEASKINFDFRVSWVPKKKKHSVDIGYSSFFRNDTSNVTTSTGMLVKSNSTDIIRKEFAVKHNFNFSDSVHFTQKLNSNNYKRTFRQTGIDQSFLRYANTYEELLDYDLRLQIDSKSMSTIGGLELSRPTFNNDRVNGGSHNRVTKSIFFQNDFKLTKVNKVITGMRYDRFKNGHVFSPRFAFLYKLNERIKLRLSSGTGFRIPSFLELYVDFYNVDNGYVVKGNKSLKPEKSLGSTINLEYTNAKIRINALAYQNDFEDKITSIQKDTSTSIIIYEYKNIEKAKLKGIELFADYLYSSFTSLKVNMNVRSAIDGNGVPLENVIPYSMGTRYSRNFPSRSIKIYVNSTFNYSDDSTTFSIHDFKIRKNFLHSFGILAGIKNLSNYTNIRNGPFIGRSYYIELIKKIGAQ